MATKTEIPIKTEMANKCEICMVISENITDLKYVIVCNDCKDEYGLETKEEEENRNRKWWRTHLTERIGRKITDGEFEDLYKKIKSDIANKK